MEDQFGGRADGELAYEGGVERAPMTPANMKEMVAEKTGEVKDKAAQLGRKAIGSIDAQRERLANAAQTTADKLQATSDYVRDHDVTAMMTDVGELVKRYPGQSLAAAAVAGFLIARALHGHE